MTFDKVTNLSLITYGVNFAFKFIIHGTTTLRICVGALAETALITMKSYNGNMYAPGATYELPRPCTLAPLLTFAQRGTGRQQDIRGDL